MNHELVLKWFPPAILLIPLAAAIILLAGQRILAKVADLFAIGVMASGFVLSAILFIFNITDGAEGLGWQNAAADPYIFSFPWMQIGNLTFTMGFMVDSLSSFMCMVVTGLASLVLVYSIFYMHGDAMYRRYFMFMCFFCFAMLGIVLSNNLLMTFVFWELVGLGSYFLIGFWYHKPPVSKDHHYQELKASYATGIDERFLSPGFAQRKAFVMNRVGDFGFLTGIMIFLTVMAAAANSTNKFAEAPLDFGNLYQAARTGAFNHLSIWGMSGETLLTLAGIFTFMGAMGKSAQFPLHTWLPDAMQGPTTGSSIIHAATMVAAGVYMTARIHPLLTDGSMFFVAMIGGLTAFVAASIAMVQWDLKAVLAYSTISQLGYMMLGLGANAYTAGVAHLFTHAVFKCMLFLCAGSVIHACHHLQDMNRMGGLKRKMPTTYLATLAGVLAIAGVPLFSGFYSKDAILAGALARGLEMGGLHFIPYLLGQVTAAMTAFYMFRLLFWTFHGEPRDQHIYDHAHESPKVATVPLTILAIGCLGFWWSGDLNLVVAKVPLPLVSVEATAVDSESGTEITETRGWLDAFMVSPVRESSAAIIADPSKLDHYRHHEHLHHTAHLGATALSILGLLAGMGLAWFIYARKKLDTDQLLKDNSGTLGRAWNLAAQLWYFDRLYQDGIVPFMKKINAGLYAFDFKIIDQILVDGWAHFVRAVSQILRNVDNWFVDRCVDLFGWTTWMAGTLTRSLQTGKIQYYVCVTFGAVAVLLVVLLMGGLF